MAATPKRFQIAQAAGVGDIQVSDLDTGEVYSWVRAVRIMGWEGEGQMLWLGVPLTDVTTSTSPVLPVTSAADALAAAVDPTVAPKPITDPIVPTNVGPTGS